MSVPDTLNKVNLSLIQTYEETKKCQILPPELKARLDEAFKKAQKAYCFLVSEKNDPPSQLISLQFYASEFCQNAGYIKDLAKMLK